MAKIIRLTESDLTRLVKRVIKEQQGVFGNIDLAKFDAEWGDKGPKKPSSRKADKGPFASAGDEWYDSEDMEVMEPTDYSEEKTFGPDEYEDFMEFINDCNTKWCLTTKRMYDRYSNKPGGIRVRK